MALSQFLMCLVIIFFHIVFSHVKGTRVRNESAGITEIIIIFAHTVLCHILLPKS